MDFPLQALLKVAKLKKSTYYYHLQKWVKPDKYQAIKERIQTLFHYHKGRYGYRRISLALRNEGFFINHKTVQRLMQELGLKGTVRPKNIVRIKEQSAMSQRMSSNVILKPLHPIRNG